MGAARLVGLGRPLGLALALDLAHLRLLLGRGLLAREELGGDVEQQPGEDEADAAPLAGEGEGGGEGEGEGEGEGDGEGDGEGGR